MTHTSKITPVTSLLFCNRNTYILLISTLHVWFIDVNEWSISNNKSDCIMKWHAAAYDMVC